VQAHGLLRNGKTKTVAATRAIARIANTHEWFEQPGSIASGTPGP